MDLEVIQRAFWSKQDVSDLVFEIQKYEGLGRLGTVFLGQSHETPTFLNIQMRKEDDFTRIEAAFSEESASSGFKKILKNSNLEFLRSSRPQSQESSTFPKCVLYPSLQMQGKSLAKLKRIEEFFPKTHKSLILGNEYIHLIPWDLPDIYLDHGMKYYKTVNRLLSISKNNHFKFMVNIPFRSSQSDSFKEISTLKAGIICLGDLSSTFNHPKYLLSYISSIRDKVTPDVMFYAPGVPSSFFPILSYLGIDLFDFTFLSSFHTGGNALELENKVEDYKFVIKRINSALKSGKLRDLVRIYANSYPPQKTLLRMIDKQIPLDQGTAIYGSESLYCTDQTDFSRPEVNRFRDRVRNRYQIGSHIQGIVFLPCSAKKPYSQSKSHQVFRSVIRRTLKSKRHSVAEIILTSPLGVVPRNLEYTYPAAHYDIPVTGDWSSLEKRQLAQDLEDFLKKCPESVQLVGYVKGTEKEVLTDVCRNLNKVVHIIDNEVSSLTSKECLYQFRQLLTNNLNINQISKRNRTLDFLRTVADYQFGKGVGKLLIPEGVRLHGHKELGIRIQHAGKHLMTFRSSTGFLTLSIEAAKRIIGSTRNIVKFEGESIRGTTIFANAIKQADHEIRINDEVIIINEHEEIIATGIAYLPGKLLIDMPRGLGVKIRQKVKENA
ncbi:MAG: DUF5591 domain-containing protein [Candidatus Hodarchaeales archaeon]|jgi:archaeosine synthase